MGKAVTSCCRENENVSQLSSSRRSTKRVNKMSIKKDGNIDSVATTGNQASDVLQETTKT